MRSGASRSIHMTVIRPRCDVCGFLFCRSNGVHGRRGRRPRNRVSSGYVHSRAVANVQPSETLHKRRMRPSAVANFRSLDAFHPVACVPELRQLISMFSRLQHRTVFWSLVCWQLCERRNALRGPLGRFASGRARRLHCSETICGRNTSEWRMRTCVGTFAFVPLQKNVAPSTRSAWLKGCSAPET